MRSISAYQYLITATLKRSTVNAGVRTAPTTVGTLEVAPLMPMQPELASRPGMERVAVNAQVTFISDPDATVDIRNGDVLVVDGKEYTVRYIEKWPWRTGYEWMVVVDDAR